MGRGLVYIKDQFLEWSTVVDAPVSHGLTRPELERYIENCYGQEGLRQLPARVERALAKGTSFIDSSGLEELLASNRAGWRERCLTAEQIYTVYCAEKREPVAADGGLVWDGDTEEYREPREGIDE